MESPEKFLNPDFMMIIYADERNQMTAFDEYISYMFENKQTPSVDNQSKFVRLDQLVAELFSKREGNKATDALVIEMGVVVAKCLMKEFRDPHKATSEKISGPRS